MTLTAEMSHTRNTPGTGSNMSPDWAVLEAIENRSHPPRKNVETQTPPPTPLWTSLSPLLSPQPCTTLHTQGRIHILVLHPERPLLFFVSLFPLSFSRPLVNLFDLDIDDDDNDDDKVGRQSDTFATISAWPHTLFCYAPLTEISATI